MWRDPQLKEKEIMITTDPVADLLTRIRNASRAEHRHVDISWSKMKEAVTKVLKEEGFIKDYVVRMDKPTIGTLRIVLKYTGRESVIEGLKRVSRPGRRHYVEKGKIPYVLGGMGSAILTTSKGVMSGRKAVKEGVGGEVLCTVW
jgi:small subunit ribosomal protein S8